jgi:chorismate mutase
MTIADWRMEIDDIDNQILGLLNQRAKLAAQIGNLKAATNQPLTDETRERGLIARLAHVNVGPLEDAAISAIFHQIIAETRRLESRVFTPQVSTRRHSNAARERKVAAAQDNSQFDK